MQKIPILLLAALLSLKTASQDFVVTWNNDTLPCVLPGNPAKEGLKPAGNYKNGYQKIAAVFSADSLRILDPGQIKSYYRKEHGKGLLCNGHFESIKVPDGNGMHTGAEGKQSFTWLFLLREQKGKYASLYKCMRWGKRLYTYYYIVKNQGDLKGTALYVSGRKRFEKILADEDVKDEMIQAIKKIKNYSLLLAEYNRLKEIAENNTELIRSQ
jgi:hypothetical protein